MSRPAVFLDRDGTINVDRGYVHRIEDWEFIAGAVEAIRQFRLAGFAVAIVSNQSAIAAGNYSLADVLYLHTYVQAKLGRCGTTIDAIAVCPHSSTENCDCRKPRPGLARQVELQLAAPIDYPASWTIGDKISDIGFGRALGSRTILLRSQYWRPDDLSIPPDTIANSLLEAARGIVIFPTSDGTFPSSEASSC
jgi:D-glycero-D-manno-heptose 1,7-bisphosphate phosphatase